MLAKAPFNLLSILDRVDDAINSNAEIASAILTSALQSFGLDPNETQRVATPSDLDKARSTIRQMYRDWSAEGATERIGCYDPVLDDVERTFSHVQNKENVRVLVPGAGLGRLVFEICRRGYTVEGNEISYHQLMASNWVLNHTLEGQSFDLYPFALEFSNVESRKHQLQRVAIPDVHAGSELERALERSTTDPADRMTMTAADFVVLYSESKNKNKFDVVVTVFFIDTAPNLIRYIETIRNCLKDRGVWINLGPLLWHFADRGPGDHDASKTKKRMGDTPGIEEPGSFELADEEVRMLVEQFGFEIQSHKVRNDGLGYIQNPRSMLQNAYRSSHWTARKVL